MFTCIDQTTPGTENSTIEINFSPPDTSHITSEKTASLFQSCTGSQEPRPPPLGLYTDIFGELGVKCQDVIPLKGSDLEQAAQTPREILGWKF